MAGYLWLSIALVLSVMVFWLSWNLCWHWGVGIVLAAIPLLFTFFLGVWGLLISGLFTAALYKVPR